MININEFIRLFSHSFEKQQDLLPWKITGNLVNIIHEQVTRLNDDYTVRAGIAIHHSAVVENGATLKAPVLIGAHCFIGAGAYLRGGVFLGGQVKIGTGCEIKTSIIFNNTAIAHFNFIGDSIIGSDVNFEAGAITANHFNEKTNKEISVVYQSAMVATGVDKFGALIGDHSKVGANAVLSPGTILPPGSIVKRLELVEQQLS